MLAKKKLLGDYNVGKTIGQGAFSKVKIGFHRETGEKVAIKIIDKKLMALKAAKAKQAQEEREKRKQRQEEDKLRAAGLIAPSPNLQVQVTASIKTGKMNTSTDCPVGQIPEQATDSCTNAATKVPEPVVPLFIKELQTEVQLLMRLDHPNIIKIFEVLDTEDECYVIMEYASGGELVDFIAARGNLPEKEARRFFRQIISAVDHCHLADVVHRDLKLENMLLSSQRNILISDFGLGRTIKRDTDEYLKTFCGTPNYAAVELISGIPYLGTKSDIWAMGVILYVMLTGKLPFYGDTISALYAKIKAVDYRCPEYFSPSLKQLLSQILVKDPKKRMTIDQLRENEWVNFEEIERPPRIYPRFYDQNGQVNPAQFIKGIVSEQNCTIYVFRQHAALALPVIDPATSSSQISSRRRKSRSTVMTYEESSKLTREVAALNNLQLTQAPSNDNSQSVPLDKSLNFANREDKVSLSNIDLALNLPKQISNSESPEITSKDGTARSRRFTFSGGSSEPESIGEFLGNSPFIVAVKPSETPVSPLRPTLSTPISNSANPFNASNSMNKSFLPNQLASPGSFLSLSWIAKPTHSQDPTSLALPGLQKNSTQPNGQLHYLTLPANVESELNFLRRMSSPMAEIGLHPYASFHAGTQISTDEKLLTSRIRPQGAALPTVLQTDAGILRKSASTQVTSGDSLAENASINSCDYGNTSHSKSLSFTGPNRGSVAPTVTSQGSLMDRVMSHLPLASNTSSHSGILSECKNAASGNLTEATAAINSGSRTDSSSIESLSVEKVTEWHQLHHPAKQIRSVRFPFSDATTSNWPPHEIFFKVHRVLVLLKARYPGQFTFQRLPDYYVFECKLEIPGEEQLKFEVEVCKVWLMKLHGVKIKRSSGSAMLFKDVYELITSELRLE